eukprot:gnl/TRDRNA2_/TRDRNA2_147363_c2_seq1.p1 gnl/TRDRNA2_/TRDRNA2_147363_c2~~gnl/TRDRNA2_/TRDRNA2_147363_c2_seq1.p1  ORF type:complete len:152 (-),score=10.90 gnl/TRDRNA2_/TRDRNA2_147363_c2_seq1:179-634(-)
MCSVSSDFLSAMKSGRNYVFRDDPVPRAYSKLQLREYLAEVYAEGRSKIGEQTIWTIKSLPMMGDYINSFERYVAQFLESGDNSDLQSYEAMASGYRHFTEIALLDGGGRTWDEFSLSSGSVRDHRIGCYVEALCRESTHIDVSSPFVAKI